jgi:hypothetical protein
VCSTDGMVIPFDHASELLGAPKSLLELHAWRRKENQRPEVPILFFESRVRVDSALPMGLRFRVSAFPRHPNVATFQLEMEQPPSRTCLTLYRLEWRPLTGHGNGRTGPEELWDLVFAPGDTHEHTCLDHFSLSAGKVLKPGVHAARKIEPDFADYESALAHVCGKLNILNPEDIPPSNAQWEMV